MNNVIFFDVDTQKDFMEKGGALYVPDAEIIKSKLWILTEYASFRQIKVFGSMDWHDSSDKEIVDNNPDFKNTFYPHCMKNTDGASKIKETIPTHEEIKYIENQSFSTNEIEQTIKNHRNIIFQKQKFDVFTTQTVKPFLDKVDFDSVFIYGVALDICVKSAVEGFMKHYPDKMIYLIGDATKAVDENKGNELIDTWLQYDNFFVDNLNEIVTELDQLYFLRK